MESLAALFGVGCVLMLGLAIGVWALRAAQERRRRDRLLRWAGQYGWTVTPHPAVDWGSQLPGRNRRGVSVAISGEVGGRPVSVAEYSYTESQTTTTSDGQGGTTTTSTPHTHWFTVIVVRLAHGQPALSVGARGSISKLGRMFFGPGDNATGNDAFDRRYRITSADPALARRLISPALVAEHVAGTVPTWSLNGTELLSYHAGRIRAPEHIPGLAGPLLRVAQHLDG